MSGVSVFGVLPDGREVQAVRIGNSDLSAEILTLGATVHKLEVEGKNVVLGHPKVEDYLSSEGFLGQTVGRYANRIAGGRFEIDGVEHRLATNEGTNTLHGGPDGVFKRLWSIEQVTDDSVRLGMTSPDGDQGFPGKLVLTALFEVSDNRFSVRYTATTSAPTPVNLTNHLYLNPDGEGSGDISGATLWVNAATITEVGEDLLPTGALVPAAGLDLRKPRLLRGVPPLDHNYVIDKDPKAEGGLHHHATLTGARGLAVDIHSDRPGLQVFTADGFDGTAPATSGGFYGPRAGIALETQDFPDAPNQPAFGNTILRPGQTYVAETVWTFTH